MTTKTQKIYFLSLILILTAASFSADADELTSGYGIDEVTADATSTKLAPCRISLDLVRTRIAKVNRLFDVRPPTDIYDFRLDLGYSDEQTLKYTRIVGYEFSLLGVKDDEYKDIRTSLDLEQFIYKKANSRCETAAK